MEHEKHQPVRVRHELRRRSLVVRRSELATPRMLRLTLGGDELDGFTSLAPDDHIKVFVPGGDGAVERRDYTPRRYDPIARELTVDFALHEAGPVTSWARNAKVGDRAEIGGPRGSVVVPHDFDWWLLVGDETALPAIGRRLGELPSGTHVTTVIAVTGPEEEQRFETVADHRALWVHRPSAQAGDPGALAGTLRSIARPPGDGFVWIAAEANVVRVLRWFVIEGMRHPSQWLKASGYWVMGQADAHEKFESGT